MHRSKQHLYSIIWSLLPINGLGTVGAVHWKQRTHVPEFFPAGPIAGAVPAVQVDSHRDHAELRPGAIQELHIVDRTLG
jgi:hypothetical protein